MKFLGMEVVASTAVSRGEVLLLSKFDWQRIVDSQGNLLSEKILVERKHSARITGLTLPADSATVASS